MAVGAAAGAFAALAEVKLDVPFGDGMVLQRDRPVPVWGTAAAGEAVKVSFAGAEVTATAGADGGWRALLPAMPACAKGRELAVNGAVRCRDVLVGEVWFASGQSNMQCPIWGGNTRYRDGKGAMMTAMTHETQIRFAKMPMRWSATPVAEPKVAWRRFEPASFRLDDPTLSAVAFYYALELHNALDVPIGVVDASWGGTNIDAWTPRCGYEGHPELEDVANYRVTADWNRSMSRGPINAPQQQPTVLWNGMVAAWTPYACRGFIWYQGCTNNGEAGRYCDKMHALYDGWSRAFDNPELSLYFVLLAPFRTDWFNLQQSQLRFAREEPRAALAVVADHGNLDDIHPNDKEIVAKRLALHALKRDYGFAGIEDESPTLRSWRMAGDRIHLAFDHAKSFYIYNDNYSKACGFEVTLPDGRKVRADVANADRTGNLRGAEVVLSAKGLTAAGFRRLTYLRNSPWFGALYGDSSLPVAPFEIDRSAEFAMTRTSEAKLGDAEKIPELAGFRKAYVCDIPERPNFADGVRLALDRSAEVGSFAHVAYLYELADMNGACSWVMTAFDAPTNDVRALTVPAGRTAVRFQRRVANLTVRSNVEGVDRRDGYDGGSIEFWSDNYSQKTGLAGIGGDAGKFDFNDSPPEPARDGRGYGSMQVHDWKGGKVIWAFNRFNGGVADIGIGVNRTGEHPDWTFMGNAGWYAVRRLTVFVR